MQTYNGWNLCEGVTLDLVATQVRDGLGFILVETGKGFDAYPVPRCGLAQDTLVMAIQAQEGDEYTYLQDLDQPVGGTVCNIRSAKLLLRHLIERAAESMEIMPF